MHQGQMTVSHHTLHGSPNPWKGATLRLLIAGHTKAEELQSSPWQHAIGIQALRSAGIPYSVLGQLVEEGQIEFALETTRGTARRRSFRRVPELSFGDRTCFVLTPLGVATARQVSFPWESVYREDAADEPPDDRMSSRVEVPRWDRELHELRVGEWVVKSFKRPAPDQETILGAFEEEGWPDHLDDPLSPRDGQDAKQRLHDTIKRLNRGQKPRIIRFMGDGQGTGIRWKWV